MAKQISIMYSVNVFFEKKIEVDDVFELSNGIKLLDAFKEIAERFPDENLKDLDDHTNFDCSSDYYGQDPYQLDSIEIVNFGNQLITSQFIKK
jgi:hypothetical protein